MKGLSQNMILAFASSNTPEPLTSAIAVKRITDMWKRTRSRRDHTQYHYNENSKKLDE
ncbi:hypothetical protein P5G61_00815 [Paenibacillus sp. F6_3S_P_1C]|uniref:Uncharacterized protein n=1 Tax=Paenibacillus vandeheii TaxID=3035917 RepID=A0ABT8J426_9BACL|nr:hypothetical protein [Paenibacillus vandeheii]MDN4599752.1 hypothetical protein [Paenibacillus vandeheii]